MIENDQLYAESCFPKERWSVSGVRLEPFSLGHALILQSIDSPFLGFDTPEFSDLMDGLWICSQKVTEHLNTAIKPINWRWKIGTRMLRRIAKKDPVRTWDSIEMFQDYVFDSLWFKPPISSRNTQLCRTSTCPAFVPMIRALMSHYGHRYSDVLNMPLKKAKWDHAAWLEHEGALNFVTQADLDIIKVMMSPENLAWNKKIREEAAQRAKAKTK